MHDERRKKITVTFLPQGQKIATAAGENLVHAARRAGMEIETPCGGRGTCGGCIVRVAEGSCASHTGDRALLNDQELARGLRLSCQMELTGDLVVDTTPQREAEALQILTQGLGRETALRPALRKIELEVPEPSLDDQRADWERARKTLNDELGWTPHPPEPELLREIPLRLREKNRPLSFIIHGRRVLDIVRGHGAPPYGVALDMGTTTVVGYLLNLEDGRELAVASTLNLQSEYGYDVMSRVTYAQMGRDGLGTLHNKGVASINIVIDELARKAGINASDIYHLTVVGNTCMHHLLLELDPQNIGLSPYIPVLTGPYTVAAGRLGISVNPRAAVDFLPNIAGFVGADTVAVLLTTLLDRSGEVCAALDIGTNGEIAMGNKDGVLVCSTAAGPAFEGARIGHGMRASAGAIHQVHVEDGALACRTVNDEPPRGICGSGLIDAAALLLNYGLMDETGRIPPPHDVEGDNLALVKDRLFEDEKTRGLVLAHPHETPAGKPVVLTQQDVRELQLAKGAILAGIQILKKELGVSDQEVAKIYLAGAFGNYLNPASAMRIGLIPSMPLKKVVSIGNAAGHGARLALLSTLELERAVDIADNAEYVELAVRADFQEQFIQAMNFPPQL